MYCSLLVSIPTECNFVLQVYHFTLSNSYIVASYIHRTFISSLFYTHAEDMSDYLTIADLGDLYIATLDARIKWRNILLVLKISSDTIDSIGTKWRDNPDDCYREGLKEWLKGGERRWEDVIKALSSAIVGHSDLARTIERDHVLQPTGKQSH